MLFLSRQEYFSLHKVKILLLLIHSAITSHLVSEKQPRLLFNQEQFGHFKL